MSQTKAQLLDPQGDFTLTGQLIGVGATFSGNVSIAGTLTKQDVTNVDSVGVITARSGVNVTGGNVIIGQGGSGANNAELKLQAGAGTGNDIIAFLNQAGATRGNITYDTDNNFLLFNVNQGEKLRINSDGQVGIRGTNTAFDTTGEPNGSLQLYYETDQGQASIGPYSSGGNTHLSFYTNAGGAAATEKLRITSAGLVGIGTAAPSAYLDVESNASSGNVAEFRSVHSSNSARILIDSPADNNIRPSAIVLANAGTDKWGIGQVYGSSSSGAFHICAGSASEANSKLTITTSGSVGIATAAPADAWLDIASTAGTEAIRMRRLSSDVNVASNWAFKAYGKNLYFREGASSPYDRVHFTDTGNVVATGTVSDSKGNLRSIPANNQSSAYTATTSDIGKVINISSGGVTFNGTGFSEGDVVTIINNSGSDQTITQSGSLTIFNSGDGSTGNRTLAGRGTATIWFANSSGAYISGSGLS